MSFKAVACPYIYIKYLKYKAEAKLLKHEKKSEILSTP